MTRRSRGFRSLVVGSVLGAVGSCFVVIGSASAATFTVSNTNNSGGGSLRQAILDANSTGGADTINFGIGSGPKQIIPTSKLPAITDAVTLNGQSQPGWSLSPIIELSGNGVPGAPDAFGLWITASNTTVKGLIINRFPKHGIFTDKSNVTITGNWIGLASDGVTNAGNGDDGIGVYSGNNSIAASNNTIGGNTPTTRNVISGNAKNGIGITAANGGTAKTNVISGNYIGTTADGNGRVPNGGDGVLINDDDSAGGGGDVSGNTVGGTSGTTPNGGCTGTCNVISGNLVNGVGLWHAQASGNLITGNHIGLNAGGDGTLYNGDIGIEIQEAPNNTVGSTSPNGRNIISGNLGAGVFLTGNASTGNVVIGNYIGTNSTGTVSMGNVKMGVGIGYSPGIQTAHGNLIGGGTGTTPTGACTGSCNVISGNRQNGVLITGTGDNALQGNHIGLNAAGSGSLSNALDGIGIVDSPNNSIGGSAAAVHNKISGNGDNGIIIVGGVSSGNRVEGNSIGLTAGGGGLGNAGGGVFVVGATDTAIMSNNVGFNGKLGIDLNSDNVSVNDPGDGDGGANRTQNYPNLYSARTKNGRTLISGQLNTNAKGSYRLDFFASNGCNAGLPFNYGEGQNYIGSSDITTDSFGNTSFGFAPTSPVAGRQYVTATATKKIGNVAAETSEFSQCILVNVAKPALTNGSSWFLKYDLTSGVDDKSFGYGFPAQWLMCAWDATQPGVRLPVVFYNGTWFMRASYTTGTADRTFSYGSGADTPICGDWNGDGVETVGVVKPGSNWDLRDDNTPGAPAYSFHFGGSGSQPIVGDWDGNGNDTVGVVDGSNTWNLRNSLNDGPPDAGNFHYGVGNPIVGDWDGNGNDTVGVVSGSGQWALRNNNADGNADVNFNFGAAGSRPLTW